MLKAVKQEVLALEYADEELSTRHWPPLRHLHPPPATWDAEEATKGGFGGQKQQGEAAIEQIELTLEA